MYFTSGSDRAFEQLMQTRPGADHFDSGEAGAPEDCGTCRFYRPHWKYQFCVYEECPYQPGKLTALDGAVKFQVKGVDDEMAVFRVEKNRGYTVMSNHHLRNKDLSLKAKGLLSQMLSLPEDWDFTLKGLSLINREQIDAIRAAVRELEQAGYIVRSRERDSQGRLRGADYIIYEQPQPVPDLPTLENPTLDIKMLCYEGLMYSVFATLVTLVLGTGLGFLSVQVVVKTMNPYFHYSFPWLIVLIYLAILLIVQFTLISYTTGNLKKQSLVEQIRTME